MEVPRSPTRPRPIWQGAAAIVITVAILYVGAGLILLLNGSNDAVSAFFDAGPRVLLVGCGLGLLIWAIAVLAIVGRTADAAPRKRFALGVILAVAAALVNAALWVLLAMALGEWAWLVASIATVGSIALVAAASAASALTFFVLFRHRG